MAPFFMLNSSLRLTLEENKKVYFVSDLHLGAPDLLESRVREKRLAAWLDSITPKAQSIFFVGDIFDFWFEYRHVVPKGFLLFFGKLANLINKGIDVHFFTGNHDLWMGKYLEEELGVKIHQQPMSFIIASKNFYVGHGDGLGAKNHLFRKIRWVLLNKYLRYLFSWLHPDIGISIAKRISIDSYKRKKLNKEKSFGMREWLIQHSLIVQKIRQHHFYVYGHRHMILNLKIDSWQFINLGDWYNGCPYAVFDGENIDLQEFTD